MIFRTYDGKLIDIKKYEYTNDVFYYQKIMSSKRIYLKQLEHSSIRRISKLIDSSNSKNREK
jgi:hypothetical protein